MEANSEKRRSLKSQPDNVEQAFDIIKRACTCDHRVNRNCLQHGHRYGPDDIVIYRRTLPFNF